MCFVLEDRFEKTKSKTIGKTHGPIWNQDNPDSTSPASN